MRAYLKSTIIELTLTLMVYICMFAFCLYKLITRVGFMSISPFTRLYALQQSFFQKTAHLETAEEHSPDPTTYCVFCAIYKGTIAGTIIAENERAFAIKDIAPQAPLHYLLIPKKHVINTQALMTQDLDIMRDITRLAQQLATTDEQHAEFKLLSNNGKRAGQHVMHLHVHFLAGY